MKSSSFMAVLVLAAAGVVVGCASQPLPAARVGSAEAATREAREAGAARVPDAAMHLRLAEDQIARARRYMDDGEFERAEWYLVRAEADAAVSRALAHEAHEKVSADRLAAEAKREAAQ